MDNAKPLLLAWMAENYVGVVESRPNGGPLVERFQRAADGKAQGEPWCVAFVQFCVARVDDYFAKLPVPNVHHALPITEWSIGMWRLAPAMHRHTVPCVGDVVIWQNNKNKGTGHAGIVVGFDGDVVLTVEANTSPGDKADQREGDGVWKKRRANGDIPGFTRLGYVSPWL
jgi:hypothetical protein